MFTQDVFAHYGGTARYGEKGSVLFARVFILFLTGVAYVVALSTPQNIFDLASRIAFSGFAAMSPVMIAALFWKRSTKWGALASTLWVASTLILTGWLQNITEATAPKAGQPAMAIFAGLGSLFQRNTANVMVYGYLPVVPMVIGSAIIMIVVSLATRPPSRATIDKYFDTTSLHPAA
jgi:Na+/proline symporter